MKPVKHWILDHEAYSQICETRRTLVAHLDGAPDDFKALVMADVVAEIDPEHDPDLRAHARRAHALRGQLGAAWIERARADGLDVLLFNLCAGMHRAEIGKAVLATLARRAAEITTNPRILALLREYMIELGDRHAADAMRAWIERRAPNLARGTIERAFLPEALLASSAAAVRFHPSGHLAEVKIDAGRSRSGKLVLAERPGAGHLYYTSKMGGYGYAIDERYSDGKIQQTCFSPWHDGDEGSERMAWTRWIAEALASLEGLLPQPANEKPPGKAKKQRATGRPARTTGS